jgi:hypothetical protein
MRKKPVAGESPDCSPTGAVLQSSLAVTPPRKARDPIAESQQTTSHVRNEKQKRLLLCEVAKYQLKDIEGTVVRSKQAIAQSRQLCGELGKERRHRVA